MHFKSAYASLFTAAQQRSQEQRFQGPCKNLYSLDTWLPYTNNDSIRSCYKQQTILWLLDSVAMPFVTLAGSYELAGQLILIAFGAQIAGVILSSCTPMILRLFSDRSTLTPFATGVMLMIQWLCLLPLFARVWHVGSISDPLLAGTFGVSYFVGRYAASEISVIASEAVDVYERPRVSRAMLLLSSVIQLVALCASMTIISLAHLDS